MDKNPPVCCVNIFLFEESPLFLSANLRITFLYGASFCTFTPGIFPRNKFVQISQMDFNWSVLVVFKIAFRCCGEAFESICNKCTCFLIRFIVLPVQTPN